MRNVDFFFLLFFSLFSSTSKFVLSDGGPLSGDGDLTFLLLVEESFVCGLFFLRIAVVVCI